MWGYVSQRCMIENINSIVTNDRFNAKADTGKRSKDYLEVVVLAQNFLRFLGNRAHICSVGEPAVCVVQIQSKIALAKNNYKI